MTEITLNDDDDTESAPLVPKTIAAVRLELEFFRGGRAWFQIDTEDGQTLHFSVNAGELEYFAQDVIESAPHGLP